MEKAHNRSHNIEDKVTGIIVIPADFRSIRSKADAERFLQLVGKGSRFELKDMANSDMYIIIDRQIDPEITQVAYESADQLWYVPENLVSGKEALEIIYRERKTLNRRFFQKNE